MLLVGWKLDKGINSTEAESAKAVGSVLSEPKAVQLMNGLMEKQFSHHLMVSWRLVIQNHVVNTTLLFVMSSNSTLLGTMLTAKSSIMHFVNESKLKSVLKSILTNSSFIELHPSCQEHILWILLVQSMPIIPIIFVSGAPPTCHLDQNSSTWLILNGSVTTMMTHDW